MKQWKADSLKHEGARIIMRNLRTERTLQGVRFPVDTRSGIESPLDRWYRIMDAVIFTLVPIAMVIVGYLLWRHTG